MPCGSAGYMQAAVSTLCLMEITYVVFQPGVLHGRAFPRLILPRWRPWRPISRSDHSRASIHPVNLGHGRGSLQPRFRISQRLLANSRPCSRVFIHIHHLFLLWLVLLPVTSYRASPVASRDLAVLPPQAVEQRLVTGRRPGEGNGRSGGACHSPRSEA